MQRIIKSKKIVKGLVILVLISQVSLDLYSCYSSIFDFNMESIELTTLEDTLSEKEESKKGELEDFKVFTACGLFINNISIRSRYSVEMFTSEYYSKNNTPPPEL